MVISSWRTRKRSSASIDRTVPMTTRCRPPGKFWLKCVEAKYEGRGKVYGREEFDEGLGDFAGVTDTPSCFLWRELMDAYPEAKVILVNRDYEAWSKSFEYTVITNGVFHWGTYIVVWLEPLIGTFAATMCQKQLLGYFDARSPREILANLEAVHSRHYNDIREACKSTPGRLLEMTIDEGWKPLCEFFGKEMPDEPFPNMNERAVQQSKSDRHRKEKVIEGVMSAVKFVAVPLAGVALAAVWYRNAF